MQDEYNKNKTSPDSQQREFMELRDLLYPFQGLSPEESFKDKWLKALNSSAPAPKAPPKIAKNPIFGRRFLEIALAACLGFALSSILHHFANSTSPHEENLAFDATEIHLSAKSE
ncbi:MAG: hypothetical protein WCI18_16945 [Pseudomonadota bacterium]